MALSDLSDVDLARGLEGYAIENGLNFMSYWDDGEWTAQLIQDGSEVITATGVNAREANEALVRMLELG